jgi:hypothetical protein
MFAIVMGGLCEKPSRANPMLLKQDLRKQSKLSDDEFDDLKMSLEVGYRLSPKGKTVFKRLQS